ncbi:MAG: 4-alpha-glucanotransferase [Myxococcales bacterium]|nr:4-alpha-glucanotransferase [Myxococcales bacterium]
MSARERLETLARLYSVDLRYHDISGSLKIASDATLVRILRNFDVAASTGEEIETSLLARERELAHRILEPVVVFWESEAPTFVVRLPEPHLDGRYRVAIHFEQGAELQLEGAISTLRVLERFTVQGLVFADLEIRLNEPVPFGYHRLQVELNDEHASALALSAPRKAFLPNEPRMWGLFAPTYALRSQQGPISGGLRELSQLVNLTKQAHGHVVATLPLMSAFLTEPFQPSPYVPVSKLFWNEMFLDLEALAVGQNSKAAQEALNSPEFLKEAKRLNATDYVDYRAQAKLHRSVLEILADEAFAVGSPLRDTIEAYVEQHPRVADYARFRAVTETRQAPWPTWPERLQNGDIRTEDYDVRAYRYHLYAQWRLEQQLGELGTRAREAGGGLYLDLPLGVHPDGYDAWRDRDIFLSGVNAGAPPDALGPDGQDWGFRPLHPEAIRTTGYRYFIECIQTQVRNAGVLRIDHVMGIHRLFCVPWGETGANGVYIRYRHEEIWAIITLESRRHGAMIVGEDLGTVPSEVREAMDRHDIQRMYVLQFELAPDAASAIRPIPANAVASLNTHDTPTFAGFWSDQDINDREQLERMSHERANQARWERDQVRNAIVDYLRQHGLLNGEITLEDIIRAIYQYLAQSPSRLVLLNLEDFWLEPNPQNVPGTSDERPNWRRKLQHPIESLGNRPEVERNLSTVANSRNQVHEG